jgi:hypothetical protein
MENQHLPPQAEHFGASHGDSAQKRIQDLEATVSRQSQLLEEERKKSARLESELAAESKARVALAAQVALLTQQLSDEKKRSGPQPSTFHVTDQSRLTEKEKSIRHLHSVLNKISESNYAALISTCFDEQLFDENVIEAWVARIFDNNLGIPNICSLYAKMASDLANYERDKLQRQHVRAAISQKVLSIYEQDFLQSSSTERQQTHPADHELTISVEQMRVKRKFHVDLIGELYKVNLLPDQIILRIAGALNEGNRPTELNVELVSMLLRNVVSILQTKQCVDWIYDRMKVLMEVQPPYPDRVKFSMWVLFDGPKAKSAGKRAVNAQGCLTHPPPRISPPDSRSTNTPGTFGNSDRLSIPTVEIERAKRASGLHLTFDPLPIQLDPEVEAEIERRFPAAAMGPLSPEKTIQALLKEVRTRSGGTRDAMTVFCAATFACRQTNMKLGEAVFSAFQLPNGIWEAGEVPIGLAWCVAAAIVYGVVADTPKFFPRFAVYLVNTGWSLDRIIHDVYGRAAMCLDCVYPKGQCDSYERNTAAELLAKFWDLIIEAVVAPPTPSEGAPTGGKAAKESSTPAQVLDSLTYCKMTDFLRELLTDMLDTLRRLGLCSQEALVAWRKSKVNPNEKVAILCQEIDVML